MTKEKSKAIEHRDLYEHGPLRMCRNPKCLEALPSGRRLCASCRYMGRLGIFIGGVIVGTAVAVVKLLSK